MSNFKCATSDDVSDIMSVRFILRGLGSVTHSVMSSWESHGVKVYEHKCVCMNSDDVFYGYWYGDDFIVHRVDGPAVLTRVTRLFVNHGIIGKMEDVLDDMNAVVWKLKCCYDGVCESPYIVGAIYRYVV